MKSICGLLLLFPLWAGAQKEITTVAVATPSKAATPRLESLRGQVWVQAARDEKLRPAKVGELLREKALLETGLQGSVVLLFSEGRRLEIKSQSRVNLPGISWENGEAPLLLFEKGQIRWRQPQSVLNPMRVSSKLFEFELPSGDFVLEFDPLTPRARAWVWQGEMNFGATNAEQQVRLKSGETAEFVGVLEEGEIAMDVLLRGRRIPRGQLSPARSMTEAEKKPFLEEQKQVEQKVQKARALRKQQEIFDQREGLICSSPKAKLNECAWTCEGAKKGAKNCSLESVGVSCVRRRCNANGVWAEVTTLTAAEGKGRCTTILPKVGPCDY